MNDYCPYLYKNLQNPNEHLCNLGTNQICLNWKNRDPVTKRHIHTLLYNCLLDRWNE
jgi:hypothetical protein